MLSGSVLPAWLILPLGFLLMTVVALHMSKIERAVQSPTRLRIRLANGWVMLFAIPLISAGFGVINPSSNTRMFTLIWMTAMGLICFSITLAVLDAMHTIRLARSEQRRLRARAHRIYDQWSARSAETDEYG